MVASALRAVVIGGDGLPSIGDLAEKAIALGWRFVPSYGVAEACLPIAMQSGAQVGAGSERGVLEVLPDWKLETDRNGFLYVRGPALASGYATKRDWRMRKWIAEDVKLGMSPADKGHPLWIWEPVDPASGVATCDLGELSSHGNQSFVRLLGRGASFVKVRGKLVDLSMLQPLLEGLAIGMGMGFGNVVVFPTPDDHDGSRLLLVGQRSLEELERLRSRFNKQVPAGGNLERSVRVAILPRDEAGKLIVEAMRKLVQEAEG